MDWPPTLRFRSASPCLRLSDRLWAGDLLAASRFAAMLLETFGAMFPARSALPGRLLRSGAAASAGPAGTCLDLLRDPLFSAVHLERSPRVVKSR
jgi:hypothetical protein